VLSNSVVVNVLLVTSPMAWTVAQAYWDWQPDLELRFPRSDTVTEARQSPAAQAGATDPEPQSQSPAE
jgi:hypothetical protein